MHITEVVHKSKPIYFIESIFKLSRISKYDKVCKWLIRSFHKVFFFYYYKLRGINFTNVQFVHHCVHICKINSKEYYFRKNKVISRRKRSLQYFILYSILCVTGTSPSAVFQRLPLFIDSITIVRRVFLSHGDFCSYHDGKGKANIALFMLSLIVCNRPQSRPER